MSQEWSLETCLKEAGDLFGGDLDLFPDIGESKEVVYASGSPDVARGNVTFDWENFTMCDAVNLLEQQLMPEESTPIVEVKDPSPVTYEIPSPVSACGTDESGAENCNSSRALLSTYGLSDTELGSMTLKQLERVCRSGEDFCELKAYRRTCLNRCYARSSRNKQHVKTMCLSKQLDQSAQEVVRLQQENETKDAMIRCLQLELQILRSMTQKSNGLQN